MVKRPWPSLRSWSTKLRSSVRGAFLFPPRLPHSTMDVFRWRPLSGKCIRSSDSTRRSRARVPAGRPSSRHPPPEGPATKERHDVRERNRWRERTAAMRAIAFSVMVLLGGTVSARDGAPIALSSAIALPDVQGRIDHLALDLQTQRLFVAALGNNSGEVIDARSGVHLESVPG